jgi:hypothetical protein
MQPDTRAFRKWKNKWDERVELLLLIENGYSFAVILDLFNARRVKKKKMHLSSLYHDKIKILREVSILSCFCRSY